MKKSIFYILSILVIGGAGFFSWQNSIKVQGEIDLYESTRDTKQSVEATIEKTENYDSLRTDLMEKYGASPEELRAKVKRGAQDGATPEEIETHRHYLGPTRFLVEDSLFPGQTKSKNALQKECRAKAYEVLRRSNAWTALIAEYFPEAVRLSIHPQACGSQKLGIQLVGASNWLTPWHGVAVDIGSNFVLMKRRRAEKLNAKLILDSRGEPSHFKLEKIEI